jgi:hypothetical protein
MKGEKSIQREVLPPFHFTCRFSSWPSTTSIEWTCYFSVSRCIVLCCERRRLEAALERPLMRDRGSKLVAEEKRNMEVSVMLSYWETERRESTFHLANCPSPPSSPPYSFSHCTRVFSFARSCSIQNLPSHWPIWQLITCPWSIKNFPQAFLCFPIEC